VLTTNQKGAIAEAAIAKEAITLGIGVYAPYGDERCDLIFDLRPRLMRVQCKWASREGDVIVARLYSARRARDGLIRRLYSCDEVDAFAIYAPATDECYWLDAHHFARRSQVFLRIAATRNNQGDGVNWASDYEFAARLSPLIGAVAQLGERLAGSQ
jgi:hypothetical protein